jgi:polysaccharide deacetylase 2 family uncharacterized protein YibQ
MARRKTRRSSTKRGDWQLAVLAGLAIVVLAVAMWRITRGGPSPEVELGDRLRELAAGHGATSEDISADDPIRKIDGLFVRTWRITLADTAAMEALRDDLVLSSDRWGGEITRGPARIGRSTHLRIDLEREAFDIELTVAEPTRVARRRPSPTPHPTATATPRPQPQPSARGRLAILLDDAGQNADLLARARALPREVAVAVLPFLPSSSEVAAAMHRTGHEVWLHLPMEPEDYPRSDPGPGAVFSSMSADEIRITVHAALNNVPHVVGVNNHMGSKTTADLRTMTWIMQELKARGVAFIDSRTTQSTVAEEAAIAQGVPVNRRHVFLDNARSPEAIRRQLDEAVYRCRLKGEAIAIGHLADVTIRVLAEELPGLGERGADLVPPSKLVR